MSVCLDHTAVIGLTCKLADVSTELLTLTPYARLYIYIYIYIQAEMELNCGFPAPLRHPPYTYSPTIPPHPHTPKLPPTSLLPHTPSVPQTHTPDAFRHPLHPLPTSNPAHLYPEFSCHRNQQNTPELGVEIGGGLEGVV